MALYRFQVKHRTRSSGQASAGVHAAYVIRDEAYVATQAQVAALLRGSAALERWEDCTHVEWHNLPSWAEDNPVVFFEAAQRYERQNARISTTLEIALPRELSQEQQVELLRDFCTQQLPRHPYVVGLHVAQASDGLPQPHAHVVYSERITDGMARTPAQHFKRYNRAHPEHGGAEKDGRFHQYGNLRAQRQQWSDLMNWHLEQAGVSARIDARSLAAQGIAREPERPLPAYHSAQVKYHRRPTPQWQALLATREARTGNGDDEQQRARVTWEGRKQDLGLTLGMTRTEVVQVITDRMHQDLAQRRDRSQGHAHTDSMEASRAFQTYMARLRGEIIRHEQYERTGKTPTPAMRQQVQRLLQQGVALGLGSQEDESMRLRRGLAMDLERNEGVGYGD